MASERKFFVGGNWKCTGTKDSIKTLVDGLKEVQFDASRVDVVVAPTFLHLSGVASQLAGSNIVVAAQNCGKHGAGAFTGSHSAQMLVDADIPWVILGHSERRSIFGETDELIGEKAGVALAAGLKLIACIGESLEEREAGDTLKVVLRQVAAYAKNISDWSSVVIAYEPVWAIGTGKTATPEDAQTVHAAIREYLAKEVSAETAAATRVIYGGSVKAANSDSLALQKDIDGFLVGGASLNAAEFGVIISAYRQKSNL